MTIALSTTSQELIKKICGSRPDLAALLQSVTTDIERKTLLAWFALTSKTKTSDADFFLIASLQNSLLKDLNTSLNPGKKEDETKKAGVSAAVKYGLLALAGTIYFGCEGFDGVTAFMGIFSSIPTIAIFLGGTLFSILSMIVFYSFDLVEISKNLGIKSSETPQLLDILLEQFKEIKAIRARISRVSGKSKDELQADLELAKMLYQRHLDLKEARDELSAALDNPYLKAGKYITAGVAGIIFFSGGFFAGQTVALAIAGLFVASMAATAWPIVVASIAVGIAALSVYWFVERPGIENLISRWRGLDKEKIDKLCKSDVVDKETEKLKTLIDELESGVRSLEKEEAAQLEIQTLRQKVSQMETLEKRASRADELEQTASRVPELEQEVSRLRGELNQHTQRGEHASALQTYSHFSHLRRTKSADNLHHLHQMDGTHSSALL